MSTVDNNSALTAGAANVQADVKVNAEKKASNASIDTRSIFEPRVDGIYSKVVMKFDNPEDPEDYETTNFYEYNQEKVKDITNCISTNKALKNRFQTAERKERIISFVKKFLAVAAIVVGIALILTGLGAGAGLLCTTLGVKLAIATAVTTKLVALFTAVKFAAIAAAAAVALGITGVVVGKKALSSFNPTRPAKLFPTAPPKSEELLQELGEVRDLFCVSKIVKNDTGLTSYPGLKTRGELSDVINGKLAHLKKGESLADVAQTFSKKLTAEPAAPTAAEADKNASATASAAPAKSKKLSAEAKPFVPAVNSQADKKEAAAAGV